MFKETNVTGDYVFTKFYPQPKTKESLRPGAVSRRFVFRINSKDMQNLHMSKSTRENENLEQFFYTCF